jgi:hypothetical protein
MIATLGRFFFAISMLAFGIQYVIDTGSDVLSLGGAGACPAGGRRSAQWQRVE